MVDLWCAVQNSCLKKGSNLIYYIQYILNTLFLGGEIALGAGSEA